MDYHRIYTVTAIILKRKSVGEADKTLTLFGKQHGKLRVIAKGIRKITSRRAPHLELFSESIVTIHKAKTWDIVGEVTPKTVFSGSYKRLEQMAGAYFVSEVIEYLIPENQEQDKVYESLHHTLSELTYRTGTEIIDELSSFTKLVLKELGYVTANSDTLSFSKMIRIIETVVERKLRTVKLLHQSGLSWN